MYQAHLSVSVLLILSWHPTFVSFIVWQNKHWWTVTPFQLLQKYAMEQAFKTFTQQMNNQNSPFGNTGFAPGSPFPFPPPPPQPSTSPASDSFKSGAPSFNSGTSTFKSGASAASQSITDIPATKVEDPPSTYVNKKVEPEDAPKKYGISKPLCVIIQIYSLNRASINYESYGKYFIAFSIYPLSLCCFNNHRIWVNMIPFQLSWMSPQRRQCRKVLLKTTRNQFRQIHRQIHPIITHNHHSK